MTVAEAKTLPLMGRPESWGCRGGKPLGEIPDGVLRQARRFFSDICKQEPNARAEQQVEAIQLILADREAHNPQQALAL
jgi:hypothetical protein